MAWYENGYFGFDTETTGVTESSDRIVSAAIVRYSSKHEVIHTLQWLINPGVEIPVAATAVNGISTEQVQAHGAPARAAINEILHVIADFSATMPLVAFNGSFDLTVLYHEAQVTVLTVPPSLPKSLPLSRPWHSLMGSPCTAKPAPCGTVAATWGLSARSTAWS